MFLYVFAALLRLDLKQDATAILTEYVVAERNGNRSPTRLLGRAIDSLNESEAPVASRAGDCLPPASQNREWRPALFADRG